MVTRIVLPLNSWPFRFRTALSAVSESRNSQNAYPDGLPVSLSLMILKNNSRMVNHMPAVSLARHNSIHYLMLMTGPTVWNRSMSCCSVESYATLPTASTYEIRTVAHTKSWR